MRRRFDVILRLARAIDQVVGPKDLASGLRRALVRRLNDLLVRADLALVQLDDERIVDAVIGQLRKDLVARVDEVEGQLDKVRAIIDGYDGSGFRLVRDIRRVLGPDPEAAR